MSRRRLLLVCSCVAALFLASPCVAAIGAGDDAKSNHRIVVLTYNIHHGEGTDGKFDLERIARVIKKASPDIVSLQEVDRATVRSKGVDQAQELARLTGMNLAFGRAIDYQGGQYGNAVLTRFVIQRTATYPLPAPEPRALLAVECSLSSRGSPEDVFTFMGTHLDWRNSIESVPLIEERFKEDPNKLALLAGDLNAGRDGPTMKLLGETWSTAAAASIDYILHRPADRWRVIEAKVLDEKVASDHPPVVAVVELLPAPKKVEQTGAAVITSARGEDLPEDSYKQSKIVFASRRNGGVAIYIMGADGNQQKRLTDLMDRRLHYTRHSCSPNGKKIAFETRTAHRRARRHIIIMDADGSNQKSLTKSNWGVADFAHSWAPDGEQIAFVRGRDNYAIHVANADGTEVKSLGGSNVFTKPSWSPDGKRILFGCLSDSDREMYVMNADGKEHKKLFSTRAYNISQYSWSPDGTQIAYLADTRICVMKPDGSEQKPLDAYCYGRKRTRRPTPGTLAWSPDGKKIAFTTITDHNLDICVIGVDSGGISNLTNSPGDDECPVWSPDGEEIAFVSGRDGNLEIYVMSADGSEQERLTDNPADDYNPSWLPFVPSTEVKEK